MVHGQGGVPCASSKSAVCVQWQPLPAQFNSKEMRRLLAKAVDREKEGYYLVWIVKNLSHMAMPFPICCAIRNQHFCVRRDLLHCTKSRRLESSLLI